MSEPIKPYRAVVVVQAAHEDTSVVEGALSGLIEDAINRGFAYEWAILTQLGENQGVMEIIQAIVDGKLEPEGDDGGG